MTRGRNCSADKTDRVLRVRRRASPISKPITKRLNVWKLCRPLDLMKKLCSDTSFTVVVIGCGLAGVAAASELRRYNVKVVLLEARDRVGGRVLTDRSFGTGSSGVDIGGSWIHGTDGNPLTSLCRQYDIPLLATDDPEDVELTSSQRMPIFDWDGSPVPQAIDRDVEKKFNAALTELTNKAISMKNAKVQRDRSLGHALDAKMRSLKLSDLQRRLWRWHCANLEYANSTDLDQLSMLHWFEDDAYAFPGRHCLLRPGYQFLVERMAESMDVRLNHSVIRIDCSSPEKVMIHCSNKSQISADCCIVTVPLGILKANRIHFSPELPKKKLTAINSLGFGLLNKVVLQFPLPSFWSLSSANCGYASKDRPGQFYIFINVEEITDMPTIVSLISGSCAAEYETISDEDICTEIVAILRSIFSGRVSDPIRYRVTRWSQDEFSLGSYSYVKVGGDPTDVATLAEPDFAGRLRFAGEATSMNYMASCHGAYFSGIREARSVLDQYILFSEAIFRADFNTAIRSEELTEAPETSRCAICGQNGTTELELLGPLLGPYYGWAWIHECCLLYSPEVFHNGDGSWINVDALLSRAPMVQCSSCRRTGASIGCHESTCTRSYHVSCAWATKWDFHRPDEGSYYFCADHRDAGARCSFLPTIIAKPCKCRHERKKCPDCKGCIELHCTCEGRAVMRSVLSPQTIVGDVRITRSRSKYRT
uniref:PHD-type domain-containing protein n=1 Tax=Spongospora subterranea TaxID=70186 RepID=A0A0H5R8U4_9EUKA|eukprot:CRZ10545.1 hypothetical protein [Spongospora subterranea]